MTPEKLKQRRVEREEVQRQRNQPAFIIVPEEWTNGVDEYQGAYHFWRNNVRPGTTFGIFSRPPTLWQRLCDWVVAKKARCTGCQYEIEHEGKKVCRTMTRTHGQPCDAFKERKE